MNNKIPTFYDLFNGYRILALVMLAASLSACSGDDGAPGQPGLTPGVDIANAQELNASITGVTVASQPVVTFKITDGNGNAVKNLPADSIDFSFVKLIPGTDGNASAWQSYINEEMQPGTGGTGTESTILASSEKGTEGVLIDNDDGTYQYTYAINVTQVTAPLAVAYQPALTHRVTFRVQGFAKLINPIYDFRPSDNATSNLFSRAIVNTNSCNSACHEQLVKHRSARFNTENCVTCHNPGSTDATTENTLDLTVMAHKIHRGESLPSVVAGGNYCIDHNGLVCFDDVVHPQDIRNCENCHTEDDPATPDAANWYKVPTVEACGSCHDDVNFDTGENHSIAEIPANNSMCTTCHEPNTTAALGTYQKHRILIHENADRYDFNILDVTFSGVGTAPDVTFSVTDPGNNNAPYDLANDTDLTASALLFYLAWDTTDYTNLGNNNGAATRTDIYSSGVLNATDNGDMTYTLTLGVVPASATGTGIVSFSGTVSSAIGDLPVRSSHKFFSITDDPANPVARRTSVDLALCDNCHQRFGYHGNRNQNLDNCAMCHNPAAARRNSPGPMDFKSFVHRIHAVDNIRYPQRVSNCLACHTADGFYPVEVDSGVLSTSINRGDPAAPPDTIDPSNNNRITPNTAACSVCHATASAKVHMELNGGHFDVCQENDGTTRVRVDFCGPGGDKGGAIVQEGCTTCHAKGRTADTATVHKID